MKRDTVKTAAGLIIIAGIVVATFLYGNAQRQAQLARDQNIKSPEAKAVAASPSTSSTATVKPSVSATPSPTPTPVAGVVDGAQATPEVLADTGARDNALVGMLAVILAGTYYVSSKRRVAEAIRVRS